MDKIPLRVLIIDDSKDDAFFLIGDLARNGYAPHSKRVADPQALEEALDQETWDIVFCDYRMPGFPGSAALDMIRQRNPDLPFVFMSGTLPANSLAVIQKADAFVSKDRPENLAQVLEHCLLHRRTPGSA